MTLSGNQNYGVGVYLESSGSGNMYRMEILYLLHKANNKILWKTFINCNNLVKSNAINENPTLKINKKC